MRRTANAWDVYGVLQNPLFPREAFDTVLRIDASIAVLLVVGLALAWARLTGRAESLSARLGTGAYAVALVGIVWTDVLWRLM